MTKALQHVSYAPRVCGGGIVLLAVIKMVVSFVSTMVVQWELGGKIIVVTKGWY